MKNSLGNNLIVTLFGESHGNKIGVTLDGLPSGVEIDNNLISSYLEKRKSIKEITTTRREVDDYEIVSGVFNGKTCGTPLTILINNVDVNSSSYNPNILRPSHADYVALKKYGGFQDYRGGGHFSGRLTAPLVVAGAICSSILSKKGIRVATHIHKIKDILDRNFNNLEEDFEILKQNNFPVLDSKISEKMQTLIKNAKEDGDSVGGVLETIILGLPVGVGEPFFDSLESCLSHAIFSIPSVKGVEFGLGFDFANFYGSQINDQFIVKDNKIVTRTNNNGGINGGISNGMPITFKTAIKPTPSIKKVQRTVNMENLTEVEISINGRHDPCIVNKASIVVDSLCAITLCDMLITSFSSNYFKE